jgi:hypothetical protein
MFYQKKNPPAAARRGRSGSGQASSMAEGLMDELVEEILLRLPPDDPFRHCV